MANISNEMIITNSSLSRVGRELINKRVYKEGTIETVGNPVITNGVASNISSTNYFKSSNFSFSEIVRDTEVSFEGTYTPSGNACCAWELIAEENKLSLILDNNTVALKQNDNNLLSIPQLLFNVENSIKITVTFLNNYEGEEIQQSCSLCIVLNKERFIVTNTIGNPINFSSYTSLILGNSSTESLPWQGNIYLADFALSQNRQIIYTPSTKNAFKFTKIGVGDGSTPLTNGYTPILNHIYYFDVQEITRSESNVLLTCTIPGDSYLTINELALYYEDVSGEPIIFSKISGLTVAKGDGLAYNLVLHVKLDINVVNTIAVPEIVIKGKEYIKYTDFLTVKHVYAYITENIERVIRLNALGIGAYTNASMQLQKAPGLGFDRPQILCRAQNDMDLYLDDCASTTSYAKLKKRFTPRSTLSFNSNGLLTVGSVYLGEDGIGGGFSTADYIKPINPYFIATATNWELKLRFHVYSTEVNQCILSSINETDVSRPLSIEVKDGQLFMVLLTTNTPIFNNKLFNLESNSSYDLTISHSEGVYKVLWRRLNSANHGEIVIPSGFNISDLEQVYFGVYCNTVDLTFSKPFSGTIDFMGVSFNTETYDDYSRLVSSTEQNYVTETSTSLSLEDFFHIPDYAHHYYHVANLGYEGTSYLEVYEGAFKGYYDRIDFLSDPAGFTFCAKVEVPDVKPSDVEKAEEEGIPVEKIILAKGDIDSGIYYFTLKEVIAPTRGISLVFELFLQNSRVVIRKALTTENIRSYIENPITLTITCNGNRYSPVFNMYKNNELIGSYLLPEFDNANINEMYLMNHAHFTGGEELEEHTVHDIIGIIGEISEEDLYYINNVLDTNF